MNTIFLLCVLLVLSAVGYRMGKASAVGRQNGGTVRLHSLPSYYGYYVALWCGLPALLLVVLWTASSDWIVKSLVVSALPDEIRALPADKLSLVVTDIRNIAAGNIASAAATPAVQAAVDTYLNLAGMARSAMWLVGLAAAMFGLLLARSHVAPSMRARNRVEGIIGAVLIVCSVIAVLTTVGIVLSLVFEAARFFVAIPAADFLFGLTWSPQTAIRADQVGSSGAFGAVPLFTGTLLIATISMLVAVPVGLMSAVYMADYAPARVRSIAKPLLEILAGIPTVVYGFFGALTVAPFVREAGALAGLEVASQSGLAAGLVMGIMIIPFVSSLSDDVINAVPQSMRDASYGLGATRSETIKKVVLPAALPGIAASVILAFSRALGETMIVVMAAGLAANLTANPLNAVTTVTVHIAALLVGDQEFDSPKTLSAFALGLVLFAVTLALNILAMRIVRKYREQYE
ncbi:MAG: phosphate ABC transporter permease subunit PstC [Rhodospirillales bacterium]|nr:phosphate ABC transporter permease subunit PstC [Rhodospirillales bacterium]